MNNPRSHRPMQKLRGIRRRLRALQKWKETLNFPSQKVLAQNDLYWHYKIPTDWALVEGPQSSIDIKRQIAQILIDICTRLIVTKPIWAAAYRVTACICLPDMHSSEICIYLDESYFLSKVNPSSQNSQLLITRIDGRQLSQEWALNLPEKLDEIGHHWYAVQDGCRVYTSQHWLYGEVL